MPKLTKEQTRLLIWLSLENTYFEICREIGNSYRQKNGLHTYVNTHGQPFKFDMRSLGKLVNEKLVTSEIIYNFGVKYEHYFLTKKGRDFVFAHANPK